MAESYFISYEHKFQEVTFHYIQIAVRQKLLILIHIVLKLPEISLMISWTIVFHQIAHITWSLDHCKPIETSQLLRYRISIVAIWGIFSQEIICWSNIRVELQNFHMGITPFRESWSWNTIVYTSRTLRREGSTETKLPFLMLAHITRNKSVRAENLGFYFRQPPM